VGNHEGAFAYTVGQRRGLRIGHPAGDGRPRYVLDISAVNNTVTVGPAERLDVDRVEGLRPLWWGPMPEGPLECAVQMRAHGDPVPAVVELEQGRRLVASLRTPARGIASGQAIVAYDRTRVVGSATISATHR
jgi:tRNA-specific 2-thiouridylase